MESVSNQMQLQVSATDSERKAANLQFLLRILWPAVTVTAVAAGLVLRWFQLGKNSLWFDEGYTAWAVSQPMGGVIRAIRADTAPPLYYMLLRGWTDLFGHSEAALRSMSALMSSVALFFFLAIAGRMLKSPAVRAVAICLFSISFMQIAYAHEARFYAMMSMLGAIDLYLVLLLCERVTLPLILATILAWTATLYTNNVMGVYLACLGVSWLVLPGARPLKGRVRDIAMVSIVCALAFAPWLPTLIAQTHRINAGFWPSVPDRWDLVRTIGIYFGIHENALPDGNLRWFLWIEIGVVILALCSCDSWSHGKRLLALMSFGVLPMVLIFAYSHVSQSIFMDRAFLASGVALPLLVGLSIQEIKAPPVRFTAAVVMVWLVSLNVMSLSAHRLGEHGEQWREACQYADTTTAHHPLVIFVSPEGEPLYDYYSRHGDYTPRPDVVGAPASFFAIDPPQTMQRLKADQDLNSVRSSLAAGGFDEVVLFTSHLWFSDPTRKCLTLLSSQMDLIDQREFPGRLFVFRFKPHQIPDGSRRVSLN